MSQGVQDEQRERLTRIVAAASLAVSSIYMVWRWGWTLDTGALWFSVPVALAETHGVIVAALLTWTAWTLRRREPLPPLADRTVDVFVTVNDEPLATIRKTVLAAREIRYPHTTWLLDDGHRDELRVVAEEIGIRYLRREVREHGKAGNLNHALAQSSGEFILQLDADHVALPQIVDRLIGFFGDDRLAFAQSPQDFYNTDAFSDDLRTSGRQLWGDQQLFFHVLQPGKDRANAAIFVGSCAMLRRAALDDVGGFGTRTGTMGTETSILLHARGWRSAYLNENLAFGLAPSTAHAYQMRQLHRAQGGMELLRRLPPLALPGLTGRQRLEYFSTLSAPLGSVQRVILYLAPIVFLTTGAFPIHASVGVFAAMWIPMVLLRAASFKLLTRGQGSLLLSDRYWMAKCFTHLLSVRAFFTPRRLAYRPTLDNSASVPLRTVAPQLGLIGVTVAALAWATYARTLGYSEEVPGWGLLALFGAVLLALWHAGLAAHVVQLSLAGRHRRAEHRFSESLSVALRVIRADGKLSSTDIAITDDLTATGVGLRCMYPIPDGARVELTLPLTSGDVHVRGHVVRHATSETQLGTVYLTGVEFDGLGRETRDAIELHCAQHAMPLDQQRLRRGGVASGLRRLRDLRGARRVDVGMPARVFTGAGDASADLGVGLLEDVSPRGGRILLDHPVSEGTLITLQIPGSAVRASGRVVFVHALQTGLGMRFVAGFRNETDPLAPESPTPWYAGVLRAAARTTAAATTGSAAAAATLAQGARTAGVRLAETSQRFAESSQRLAQASQRTAVTLSQRMADDLRADAVRAVERATQLRAASATAAAGAATSASAAGRRLRAAAAAISAEPAIERISLEPMEASARASREAIAASAAALAAALAPEAAAAAGRQVAATEPDPERAIEMEIDGEFTFPFELSVGATLLITETGRVAADIAAVHAIVLGRYAGTLRASRSIRVGPHATVEGVLEAPSVEIDPGAMINGAGAEPHPHPTAVAEGDDVLPTPSSEGERMSVEPATHDVDLEPAVEPADDEIFVASPIFTEGVSGG